LGVARGLVVGRAVCTGVDVVGSDPPSALRPRRKTTAASPVTTRAATKTTTRTGGLSVRLTVTVSARCEGRLKWRSAAQT
jgi:hypothetical protein